MSSLAITYLEHLQRTARYARAMNDINQIVPEEVTNLLQEYVDTHPAPPQVDGVQFSPMSGDIWADFKEVHLFYQQQAERDLLSIVEAMGLELELSEIPIRFVHIGFPNAFAISIPQDQSRAIAISSSLIPLVGTSYKLALWTLLTSSTTKERNRHISMLVEDLYSDAMLYFDRELSDPTEDMQSYIRRKIRITDEIPDGFHRDGLVLSFITLRFLIAHELAHHALGHHQRYPEQQTSLPNDRSIQLSAYSRELELEADSWAQFALIESYEHDMETQTLSQGVPGAFFSLLHLIDQWSFRSNALEQAISSSHPPPLLRAKTVMATAGLREVTTNPGIEALFKMPDFFLALRWSPNFGQVAKIGSCS